MHIISSSMTRRLRRVTRIRAQVTKLWRSPNNLYLEPLGILLSMAVYLFFRGWRLSVEVVDWLFWICIFCYIIIVNFVVFHLFQFSNYLLFNKSISSIESSVQIKTAQEMTKDSNTYNSFRLETVNHEQFPGTIL